MTTRHYTRGGVCRDGGTMWQHTYAWTKAMKREERERMFRRPTPRRGTPRIKRK